MNVTLYQRVALRRDVPESGLRAGDVATVVDRVEHLHGGEPGCVVEVFNALGDSIAIVAVRASDVEPLREDEVLTARPMARVRLLPPYKPGPEPDRDDGGYISK